MTRPVRLTKTFAERVAKKLNAPESPTNRRAADSRFYDVRPARILGEWSRNDAGLWTAKANFIVGDAVDASFEFDVAAPLALESETAPTAADATAFVVWRGRWELLTAPAESPSAVWVRNAEESDEDYFKATKFCFVGALSVIDAGNEVANVTYTAGDKVELFGGVPTVPTSEFTSVGGPVHYYDENCFGLIKKINAGKTAYCLTAKPPKIKKADVSNASYITELVTDVSLNADGTLNVVKTPVELVFDGEF